MTMSGMDGAALQCRDFVKRHDLDAYLGTLLSPEAEQPRLFAIWAIAVDALRLPWSATEPTMAMIRLQWWRDALEAGGGHPAFVHLTDSEVPFLIRHLDAVERLHGAPFDDPDEAEDWGRQTFLPLLHALGGGKADEKTSENLVALYGLVLLLRRTAFPRRTGLPLLANEQIVEEVKDRAIALAGKGRIHCRHAAWLPFAMARRWMREIADIPASKLLKSPPELSQWRRQVHLLRCHLMRRL